ncbi:MAG: glutamate--cysteine ligase [Bradymonadaceae bacterium]|nr:glutamate--cysteine ligase [Lujinxingiaceae bacterium]
MSRDQLLDARLIEDHDQLLEHFRLGEKDKSQRSVGTEHEKFVFRRDDYQMLSYEEQGGFGDLFTQLVERFGWEAAFDRGKIAALTKNGAAITLEPGGQFELSGAILKTVFETEAEFDAHIREIKALADERLAFAIWGVNPFFEPEQVPWMPKARYEIMRRYLPTRGDHANWMMKATCTVQANFDYTSESEAAEIMRTGLLVSPIVSALFANSPLRQNQNTGMKSYRGYAWTRTDPDRTGFLPFMYRADWGFRDYLEYLLDVPMFFIRRDDVGYIDLAGLSFRKFIAEGYGVHRANMGDFELHISTLFPEIRLKQYIEVRGADGGPRESVLALPAIWKGIFYHEPSRRAAAALFNAITPEDHREVFMAAYKDGINAKLRAQSMQELAQALLQIAGDGLDALALQAGHPSESVFLEPLRRIAQTKRGYAERLLEDFDEVGADREQLVARWAL